MDKILRSARAWAYFLAWMIGYLGLVYWLIGGRLDRTLLSDLPWEWGFPIFLGLLLMLVLWSALPKWRRIENADQVLWSANLPSRLGSFIQAIISPMFVLPSPGLAPEWLANHDYPRMAGAALLLAATLWIVWRGLREAAAEKVSVKVSATGIQVRREIFAWSDIQAIESGYLEFEGGGAIVLAGRTIRLSPDEHGPTGRALVGAVQRFSPGTEVREPEFRALFGAA
jgi:hypothetical protein